MTKKRLWLALTAAAGLLLMGPALIKVGLGDTTSAEATPTTSTTQSPATGTVCEDPGMGFLAYWTADAKFGPAVEQRDLDEALEELHRRRCVDPALVVAHEEFYRVEMDGGVYGSHGDRDARIEYLAGNRAAHDQAVAALEAREDAMVAAEIRHMETDNWSMWMLDTQPRPTIAAGESDVRVFDALVFTDTNRKGYSLKLDCGFQPMIPPNPPGIPPVPSNPPEETPPSNPPEETPPSNPPEETLPSNPPEETPPSTTVSEGKDHEDSPVSSDPDDPIEVVRPNVSAPPEVIRPDNPSSTTQAPPPSTIPTPSEVTAPQPAINTLAPTPYVTNDPAQGSDADGDGIPD